MSTCYALGTVPESLTCTLMALRGGRCCYQESGLLTPDPACFWGSWQSPSVPA
ncbi:unnamed protein product [Gulo gulo]|uniref:Uncharacterized protein n=1 Tax=Gulo gulo TaxID=48420 RepID=A0A9X9LUK5_GULGU|nr:unnamed protein product [Gulo gulo]